MTALFLIAGLLSQSEVAFAQTPTCSVLDSSTGKDCVNHQDYRTSPTKTTYFLKFTNSCGRSFNVTILTSKKVEKSWWIAAATDQGPHEAEYLCRPGENDHGDCLKIEYSVKCPKRD